MSELLDEFAVAGGLRGEPVDLVPARPFHSEVPAAAEIVLEGEIPANYQEHEGPFGEYTGYMGPAGQESVFHIKCDVPHQPDLPGFHQPKPPSESSCIRGIGRSGRFQASQVHS
jgi:UbiD family decarboxylase